MFFREKKRIIIKEKSSFKDFSKAYLKEARTINRKLSHTEDQFSNFRPESTFSATGLYPNYKSNYNEKISKESSTCINLDKFIKVSPFANQKSYTHSSFVKIDSILNKDNKINIDFPNNYTQFNPLVTLTGRNIKSAINYHENNFKTHRNQKSLNDYFENIKNNSPSKRFLELKKFKSDLEEYQKNKQDFLQSNKKFRIVKKGFKSGVINVDNPENDYTIIYKEEHDKLKTNNDFKEIHQKNHQNYIANKTATCSDIEFFNKNIRKIKNINEPIRKIIPNWTTKHIVNDEFIKNYKNTNERLFGSEHLNREKIDSHHSLAPKRKFDIISQKKNEILY